MANEQNLRTPDTNTAREMQKKSIKKRSENIRRRKLLRECLEELLERKWDTEEGKKTGDEAASIALMKKVLDGDTKAFEILRDTIGEKPVERIEANTEIVVNWSDDDNG